MIYGIWLFQFLETRLRIMIERWDPWWTKVKLVIHLTRFTNASNLKEWSMIWIMLILFPQTSNLRIRKLCCMCSKTMKLWSRWSLKAEVLQWDMFPGPTELLLIGCSIESIWTQKSKSNTLTPKTNSQTCWPRENSHMMNGIIFCVCLTWAISVLQCVLKWCRKEHKKESGTAFRKHTRERFERTHGSVFQCKKERNARTHSHIHRTQQHNNTTTPHTRHTHHTPHHTPHTTHHTHHTHHNNTQQHTTTTIIQSGEAPF